MNEHTQSILVVDDDHLLRDTLVKSLKRRGYPVAQASNIVEAREVVEDFSPDWVILDLRMPKQTGLQLIPTLKQKFPKAKIVMLTGYGSIVTAVSAMRLGAHNYITKPANVDAILSAFESRSSTLGEPAIANPSLADYEWEHIQQTLNACKGNISLTAKKLGIHRRSLQRKLNRVKSGEG